MSFADALEGEGEFGECCSERDENEADDEWGDADSERELFCGVDDEVGRAKHCGDAEYEDDELFERVVSVLIGFVEISSFSQEHKNERDACCEEYYSVHARQESVEREEDGEHGERDEEEVFFDDA